jgi:hypothetical protein
MMMDNINKWHFELDAYKDISYDITTKDSVGRPLYVELRIYPSRQSGWRAVALYVDDKYGNPRSLTLSKDDSKVKVEEYIKNLI